MTTMKEIRQLTEYRVDDEEMTIEGYAVVFESPATHGYTEIIDRHALDECDMSDVCLKYNHDDTHVIMARTRNKSLTLDIDEHGLHFKANLIDTQANKDMFKMIKSGLIDKCSFAFFVDEDEYDYDTDTRRILKIGKMVDVSVVNVPWYDGTEVSARSVTNEEDYMKKINAEKRKRLLDKIARMEILAKL